MKTKTYTVSLIALIVIAVGVMTIYYNQDVSEKITFKDSISLSSLEITPQKNNVVPYEVYQVGALIGLVTVKNNGLFTWKYALPQFIGCIQSDTKEYTPILIKKRLNYYGYGSQTIEVLVGKTKEITLYGVIENSAFFYRTPKEILIYKKPTKEYNPLSEIDRSYSYYSSLNCNELVKNSKPFATISLLA